MWSGDITECTFDSTSFQLEGVLRNSILPCSGDPSIPSVGDTVRLTGQCGNNVAIEYSSSNSQIHGTFTGNVECIASPLPLPIPILPPEADTITDSRYLFYLIYAKLGAVVISY